MSHSVPKIFIKSFEFSRANRRGRRHRETAEATGGSERQCSIKAKRRDETRRVCDQVRRERTRTRRAQVLAVNDAVVKDVESDRFSSLRFAQVVNFGLFNALDHSMSLFTVKANDQTKRCNERKRANWRQETPKRMRKWPEKRNKGPSVSG